MSIIASYIFPHPPLIIPDVGRGQENDISATVDACIKCAEQISNIKPDTIIVISPHTTIYADYFHISKGHKAFGSMARFNAYNVRMEVLYDEEMVSAISAEAFASDLPAGTEGETDKNLDHATFIPLWFVNKFYKDYKVVRMGFSGLSPYEHYSLGKCIARASETLGRNTVIIASGDLSHKLTSEGPYGFAGEGPEFDRKITSAMAKGDFLEFLSMPSSLCEKAGECGLRSFQIMSGALDGLFVEPELLSYEGPFGVGYGVASFKVTDTGNERHFDEEYLSFEQDRLLKTKSNESEIVKLARKSLETYVNTGKHTPLPKDISDELIQNKAGVFVSLKKHGQLRGCIGTTSPTTESIAAEVIQNAISAGINDPRFPSVRKNELKDLSYSVDVLGSAEPIDFPSMLDPRRYGVIVKSGLKKGLLLPDLEGIDTAEEQIKIACSKAGIDPGEDVSLERFEVVRYK